MHVTPRHPILSLFEVSWSEQDDTVLHVEDYLAFHALILSGRKEESRVRRAGREEGREERQEGGRAALR